MSGNSSENAPGLNWHSLGLPHSLQIPVWVCIIMVFVLSFLDLTGWIFSITLFKSIMPQWIPMKIITATCFIFAATALVIIQANLPAIHRKILPKVLAIVICLISVLNLYVYLYFIRTGHESSLTGVSYLGFFLSPGMRMAFLTACNFFIIGCVLFLLSADKTKASGIAHILIIPVALVSYFVLVSYILGVYSANDFMDVPVAMNSGIAFCGICAAVLLIRPGTWLLKVFTSDSTGGIFARRLLPGLLLLPVLIGWLRIKGERTGTFESEVGVVLVALTYSVCFVWLIWMTARSVNRIDEKRRISDEALKKSYAELDIRVKERTSELLDLNRILDAEIIERRKAQETVNAERKRFYELLELMPAYLILLTPDYHVPYANRFFRERFGEAHGRRCYEYLFNRTEPCEVCDTYHVLKDNEPHTWEWTGPDGRNYSIFDFPFTDADGSPLIMEMGIDVTELKHAEAKLKNLNLELEQRVTERTEELLGSEQRYRLLFEGMTEGFALHEIILDKKGKPCDYRFLSINPAYENHTGLKAEKIIGKKLSEVLPAAEKFWIDTYGKVALTGESIDFENYSSDLNSYFRVSAFSPEKGYFAVLIENVTDRVLAEKELQNTKNYLENLINYANAPIIVWNPGTEIQLFNHAFEHLTGYSSSEVEGKKLDLLFPESSLKKSNAKIKHALTKNWETIEIPILTKNKEIRTVLWNSANIYDTDNKTILSTIAQGNDITERIKAEQEVSKSKEKLDIALESGNIGIWEWNIRTDAFEWDERMGKMFGSGKRSLKKKYSDFEKHIYEDDIPHFRKVIQRTLKEDFPFELIYRIIRNKGDISYISTKASIEKDNNGTPVKMTGVCFDITEMKKETEQTLFNLNEDLLRSNKELEQFAYVASHDLQEPLRMVSSFTQLLSMRYKDKLDQEAQEFIRYAVDGALRMQSLINDLLEYSRVETRGKSLSVIDMHSVLGQTINNLSIKIKEKNALVTSDELPTIFADAGQMVQLLQNLIDNALKFCKTSPRVHISGKEAKDHYLFSVKDNGIGIEPQYFDKIFQIFQRLHQREEYGGTGIGLAICRRIVERHGGKIWVESKPGEGTIFKFTIRKN